MDWLLDKIDSLRPSTVIASHKRPGSDDNPQIIEETRQYICITRCFLVLHLRSIALPHLDVITVMHG
jgi:hypothetical protein